eukprot:434099_1
MNLEKLTTIFPAVETIKLETEKQNDQFLQRFMYLDILSFLQHHSNTKLKEISISIPEKMELINTHKHIANELSDAFNTCGWEINVNELSVTFGDKSRGFNVSINPQQFNPKGTFFGYLFL